MIGRMNQCLYSCDETRSKTTLNKIRDAAHAFSNVVMRTVEKFLRVDFFSSFFSIVFLVRLVNLLLGDELNQQDIFHHEGGVTALTCQFPVQTKFMI